MFTGKPAPDCQGANPGLNLAPTPPGMINDRVTLSGRTSNEPSGLDTAIKEYKESPVKPMFGGPAMIKGITVTVKI